MRQAPHTWSEGSIEVFYADDFFGPSCSRRAAGAAFIIFLNTGSNDLP